MKILCDIVYFIYFIFLLPFLYCKGKWHEGMRIRRGGIPEDYARRLSGKKNIWVHAVSVGEVLVIVDLVKLLKEKFAGYQIVCSTVTATGHELASERLREMAVVIYAPLDFSRIARKFVDLIAPVVYISAETEIWPNTYRILKERQIPVIQVNGRISDRSYRGYRWVRWLIKDALDAVTVFCMQSQLDARRIIELGADPRKVRIVGNLKFDHHPQPSEYSREALGYTPDHQVWLAGSTHPGEERMLLEVFQKAQQEFPELRLIIAPRHIDRVDDILKIIRAFGFSTVKLSQLEGYKVKDQVVVVDSVGKLASLYEVADLVFVGKSLVDGGGQNIMEPAWFGKPIMVGPYTQNFRDVVHLFLREGAIKQVQNIRQLGDVLVMFLKKPEDRQQMGRQARLICEQNIGATGNTLKEIVRQVPQAGP
jgi:3-deoxy-D-manno-octulosonic-acid transferase